MAQLEPRHLRRLLFDYLKPSAFEGENPYLVTINDTKLWIYLKNLSPAYFKNPDVWRAQLPIRDIFNECKRSPYPFILLGYDDDNDVYATWNPTFTKQRLNEAESVSFYSRLALQQEVGETQELMSLTLQNDNKVICFPRSMVLEIITSIDTHFSEDSDEYVAVGSKRRSDANAAYRELTDTHNIAPFFNFLMEQKGYSEKTANNYSQAIKRFITKGTFCNHRTLFLKYDSVSDYHKVYDDFFSQEDVRTLNESSHHIHSNAFSQYLDFLIDKAGIIVEINPSDNIVADSEEEYAIKDWETQYTDSNGKLTKIANPQLLKLLRPLLDTEYRSTNAALNVIHDFYADKFSQEVMELKDWLNLINNIEWDVATPPTNPNTPTKKAKSAGSKEYNLVVTLSDGTTFRNTNNTKTFLDVIEYFGADYIIDMGIMVNGRNLISRSFSHPRLKEIPSGFFVDVNYKTDKKAEIIQKIASEFGEEITVELIPFNSSADSTTAQMVDSSRESSAPNSASDRQKIAVTFKDNTVLRHNQVVRTFIDTLVRIGLEKVYSLNLNIGPHSLVVNSPTSPDSHKYTSVGNGWHIHVNSRTDKKYQILSQIVSELGLNVQVQMIEGNGTSPISQIHIDSIENENTSSRDKIKVTFPNGRVICHTNVADTLIEVVKYAGVDNVEKLDLTAHNSKEGQRLIVREVNPKYKISTKPVSSTQFVFTNSPTISKYTTIKIINDKLNLGLVVELLIGVNKKKNLD